MKKSILAGVVLLMVCLINISASVSFSEPEEIYNVGQTLKTVVELSENNAGPLAVYLKCDSKSKVVLYNIAPDSVNKIELALTQTYIDELNGNCYFYAEYDDEKYTSAEFEISKELEIELDETETTINPGETIKISGNVKTMNGENAKSFVEFSIVGLSDKKDSLYADAENGSFNFEFQIPSDAVAGDYVINIKAYDEYTDGKKASQGKASMIFKINSILTYVQIILNTQTINPSEPLIIQSKLLDQSGKEIQDSCSMVITNSVGSKVYEKILSSGESFNYLIPTDLSSGDYVVQVSAKNKSESKNFFVNALGILDYQILNETLAVTNIGNSLYDGNFEIELGNQSFIKQIYLFPGEKKLFRLTGDGNYEVSVNNRVLSSLSLTGRAVDVTDVEKRVVTSTPMVWIFILLILGGGMLFFFRENLKRKSIAYPVSGFGKKIKEKLHLNKDLDVPTQKSEEIRVTKINKSVINKKIIQPKNAEQVLVLHGQKNTIAMITIKLKKKISLEQKIALKEIIIANQKNGVFYEQGDYMSLMLVPTITRTFKNNVEVAKIAQKIESEIKLHNNSTEEKIEYGISIGTGEAITKIEEGKLKFTALGNFMLTLKNMATLAENRIFLTKEIVDKTPMIKGIKKKIEEQEVYELERIVDEEENQKFLKGFVERMKKEEKRFK